jgi:hypothetical protein
MTSTLRRATGARQVSFTYEDDSSALTIM